VTLEKARKRLKKAGESAVSRRLEERSSWGEVRDRSAVSRHLEERSFLERRQE
jgi:hypothetical protein